MQFFLRHAKWVKWEREKQKYVPISQELEFLTEYMIRDIHGLFGLIKNKLFIYFVTKKILYL